MVSSGESTGLGDSASRRQQRETNNATKEIKRETRTHKRGPSREHAPRKEDAPRAAGNRRTANGGCSWGNLTLFPWLCRRTGIKVVSRVLPPISRISQFNEHFRFPFPCATGSCVPSSAPGFYFFGYLSASAGESDSSGAKGLRRPKTAPAR